MSLEQHIIGLGASHSSSKEERKKAFAALKEYCEQHPEEAKAFAASRKVTPDDLLSAFYRGWSLVETAKSIWGMLTGGKGATPPSSAPPPAA